MLSLFLCLMLVFLLKPLDVCASPASTDDGWVDDEDVYSSTPHPKTRENKKQKKKEQQNTDNLPVATVVVESAPAKAPAYVAEVLSPVSRETFPAAAAVLDAVGWDLRSAYNWSVGLTYYGHGKPDMPEDGSPGSRWFADFGFSRLCGNCFVYAATFYEMARLLGYPGRQIYGFVPSIRGGLTPHSWVELDINGATYLFDPECQHATGRNCFMFTYGAGGTWRYSNYAPMAE